MARRATVAALLLAALGACGDGPVVFVGTTAGTPIDVPDTWQEHWFEHTQLLSLAWKTDHVAVYVDADVDRAKAEPLVPFLDELWRYTVATYGSLGPGRLYVVLHQGRYLGCHMDTRFSALHDDRNVMDCGSTSYDDLATETFLLGHLAANIVENASDGRSGSPAFPLWGDSKWAEFYQYDADLALGRAQTANDHYAQWTSDAWVDAFPRAGTHWFRDWFFPIWRDDGGARVMARFFAQLAASFPNDGVSYTRAMNWGELVHFMSAAAGRDLRPLATTAFGWPADWDALYAQARVDFPQLTY
jgi:hypothetical protein